MNSALPSPSPARGIANRCADPSAEGSAARQLGEWRALARAAWAESDPIRKCALVARLTDAIASSRLGSGSADADLLGEGSVLRDLSGLPGVDPAPCADATLEPGRPALPELVLAHKVPRRSAGSAAGLAALLHSIAHIEFNAINLALDAIWRFDAMPAVFVADWASVAADEARHFQLLTDELALLNTHYGDFTAHDGLWTMARRTAHDLLSRMALVPRVLEARGLDATPVIQRKLRGAGHDRAVAVLQIILNEEVRHVAIGNNWYAFLCRQAGVDPEARFRELIGGFDAPLPKGPINRDARLAAGFSTAELDWLQQSPHE